MTEERKRELVKQLGPTIVNFIAFVYFTKSRCVLVHRRLHGWREYIILRFWQRHKVKQFWYPSKRSFVVPVDKADEIVEAIQLAARGVAGEKPTWLTEREAAEDDQPERIADVGVSADTIEREQERLERDRRERV